MNPRIPGDAQLIEQQARPLLRLLSTRLGDLGDTDTARNDPALVNLWTLTSPEVRQYTLLLAAWEARTAGWNEQRSDGVEGRYAREFTQCASSWTALRPGEEAEAFCTGQHPAAFATSSLAFDRDDLLVSLATALLLIDRATPKERP